MVCSSFMALESVLCSWMILEPQPQFTLCFLEEDKSATSGQGMTWFIVWCGFMYGWWIIEQNSNKYVTDSEINTVVISLFFRTENTAMIAGLGKVKLTQYKVCCLYMWKNKNQYFFLFFFWVKAAELVSLNLAEYEAHFLDIRCYLEQKLLVSLVSAL